MKNVFTKISAIILVVIFSLSTFSALEVSASDYSYSYMQSNGEKEETADRASFLTKKIIDGRTIENGFNTIMDLQFENNELYILDSGNSRIVVLDKNYEYKKSIIPHDAYGNDVSLKAPEGLFIDKNKKIYIADTENNRLLKCDNNGLVNKVFNAPESNILPTEFSFTPVDVLVDNNDYLYILLRGSYYGALLYNSSGDFVGFYGSNTVSYGILDGISQFVTSLFETNDKLSVSIQKLPYQFNDFSIDQDGYIYTVSSDSKKKSGQIRKLNSGSSNILKYKNGYKYAASDDYNFGEKSEYSDLTGKSTEQHFAAITVDNNIIYALDDVYGKIYIYDTKCNPVSVFGGGMSQGSQQGLFQSPSAIEVNGNDVLVSDKKKNTITVFSRTVYGNTLLKAIEFSSKDDYSNAKPLWKTVLKYNSSNQLANQGLAKICIEEKDYSKAIKYAKIGNDQETYSLAFEILEMRFLNKNMWWILALFVFSVGAISFAVVFLKKKNFTFIRNKKLKIAINSTVHPFDSFQEVKSKNNGSVLIASVVLFFFYISVVSNELWTGFMYKLPNSDFNALYSLFRSVGVLAMWVVVQSLLTTLFSGKGNIKQIYVVSCYGLIPVIIYKFLYLICSHLIVPSNTSMLTLIGVVAVVYSAFVMIVGFITIHEYTFFKVLGVALLTVIGMMIVTFILFMMLTLGQGCLSFVMNIFSEIAFR